MSRKNKVIEDHKLNIECRHCIKQKKYGGECIGKTTMKKSCILFEKA